jgi:nucleobase:cation symporter-1, NCS1 family
MNDYSGSLALQTVGVRLRRPVAAGVVTIMAFLLILWLHHGDVAAKFENVLLFVGYWIPGFVAIVGIDWYARRLGRGSVDPLRQHTARNNAIAALVVFVAAFGAAVPFMDTSLYVGPVANALHGADIAYFVAFIVAVVLYAPYRLRRGRAGGTNRSAAPQSVPAATDQAAG